MDPTTIGIAVVALSVLLAALVWLKNRSTDDATPRPRPRPRVDPADQADAVPRGGRRGARMRRPVAQRQQEDQEDDEQIDEEREELEEAGVKVPEGQIGKKKMAKLQQKAEKKKAREADEREREEKAKRKEEDDREDAERREREEEEEKKEEEAERKKKEEKERREEEEYQALKASFAVEESGFDEEDAGGEEDDRLRKFVEYIKATKVVVLEDLAAHFKMKTQDTIDRVAALQEEGTLTGVVDDRGKFIYISQEELEAVAKFIRQRGRVSIAELAESSNKLINITPEQTTT